MIATPRLRPRRKFTKHSPLSRLRGGWCLVLLVGLAASCWASPVVAQAPHRLHSVLAQQLGFLDFRVSMGRLRVTTDDPTRNFTTSSRQNDRQEKLSVEFQADIVSLTYSLTTPTTASSVRAVDSHEFIVRIDPVSDSKVEPLLFIQPADGLLQLTVGGGEQQREVRAPSIWQLYLAEHEVCQQRLFPLLELMRPNWQLIATAKEIEQKLRGWSQQLGAVDPNSIERLIDDLGSTSFVTRRAAERSLVELGPTIVPQLRRTGREHLDNEQRRRIRQILDELGNLEEADSSRGAPVWLSCDPRTWAALLHRDDLATRELALAQLQTLLHRKVSFDPQADAAARRAQLQKLEATWDAPPLAK